MAGDGVREGRGETPLEVWGLSTSGSGRVEEGAKPPRRIRAYFDAGFAPGLGFRASASPVSGQLSSGV